MPVVNKTKPGGARSVAELTDGTQICPRCRTPNEDHYNFCHACGSNLKEPDASGFAFRDPLIGAVVADRYRLIAKIGIGGMGTVYKVEHVRMGKVMAMKLLHGDLTRDETIVRRFTREARAVSRLRGRHTVQIFDFGCSDGLFFIVMEYLQGRDLGDLLVERGALSPLRTARIIRQVCQGLAEAHEQSIVHRDLKPENIFVCAGTTHERELIKLLDFGLAKLQKREDSLIHTQRGLILGTPLYMSPEQIDGEDVDHLTDLYALGAVTWKILTGEPPFPGDSPLRILNAHLDNKVPRISEIKPELAHFDEFFFRALAKSPRERFRSVADFAETFETLVMAREPGRENLFSDTYDAIPAVETSPGWTPDQDEDPDTGDWLLPKLQDAERLNLATPEDFDRFERRFRLRRLAVGLGSFALAAGLIWFVVWGFVFRNLYDTHTESEPNDSLKEANELPIGESVLGSIGEPPSDNVRADRDFYRITGADRGSMLSVKVTAVPEIDLIIDVVTSDGHLLLSQNAVGEGKAEVVSNVPVGDDDLYVLVREVWREGHKAKAQPDLLYAVTTSARQPLEGEEVEPNDTSEDSNEIQRGVARGIVSREDDLDMFRMPRLAGHTRLRLALTGVPRTDIVLSVLDGNLRTLVRADDRGLAEGERVDVDLDMAQINQPLYLQVSSLRGHAPSTHYTLEARTSEVLADQRALTP